MIKKKKVKVNPNAAKSRNFPAFSQFEDLNNS